MRVAILLGEVLPLALPVLWNVPFLDRTLLAVHVEMLGCGDDGGVDDLAAHRQVAGGVQRSVELPGQNIDPIRPLPALR